MGYVAYKTVNIPDKFYKTCQHRTMSYEDRIRGYVCMYVCMYV